MWDGDRSITRACIALASLAGCVGDSNTTSDGGSDSAPESDVTVETGSSDALPDALEAEAPCDMTKPFDAPVAVGGVKGESAWLSSDELTIYPTQFSPTREQAPST